MERRPAEAVTDECVLHTGKMICKNIKKRNTQEKGKVDPYTGTGYTHK